MLLSYGKYIELLSALDEHCKGMVDKFKLQDEIFNHYMSVYNNSFVAENINRDKQLFITSTEKTKHFKATRKLFRNFMNTEKRIKHDKRVKV